MTDAITDHQGNKNKREDNVEGRAGRLKSEIYMPHGQDVKPVRIPEGVPKEDILFTANRYISNGTVRGISHVVFVDPERYSGLGTLELLNAVGRAVGKLNKILPRKKFILIGPGRWGSRGDIKLGVHVSYSDICNTAMLVEVGRKRGDFAPDVSFGTHFFQDLVEASIRYLPLYPDDDGILFNESFMKNAPSALDRLLPEVGSLTDIVRVIDLGGLESPRALDVIMDADHNEALGLLTTPSREGGSS